MKHTYIRVITILGLVTILSMQYLWLYNTYNLVKKELSTKASNLLENALIAEFYQRKIPAGTEINIKDSSIGEDDMPENAYLEEALAKKGSYISMKSLYIIYNKILKKSGFKNEVIIYQLRNKKKIVSQYGKNIPSFFTLKTNLVPIRPDFSLAIQAELVNPNELFFSKMGLLLLSTAIMMCFVIGCIIYYCCPVKSRVTKN